MRVFSFYWRHISKWLRIRNKMATWGQWSHKTHLKAYNGPSLPNQKSSRWYNLRTLTKNIRFRSYETLPRFCEILPIFSYDLDNDSTRNFGMCTFYPKHCVAQFFVKAGVVCGIVKCNEIRVNWGPLSDFLSNRNKKPETKLLRSGEDLPPPAQKMAKLLLKSTIIEKFHGAGKHYLEKTLTQYVSILLQYLISLLRCR